MKITDLLSQAESLPVEGLVMLVDVRLRSLNPPEAAIDRKWAAVARRHLQEMRAGNIVAVPGEEVFAKIWRRFQGMSVRFHPDAEEEVSTAIQCDEDVEPGLGQNFAVELHAAVQPAIANPLA